MKTSHKAFHPRPVARCGKCQAITTNHELMNTTCGNRVSNNHEMVICRPGYDWKCSVW